MIVTEKKENQIAWVVKALIYCCFEIEQGYSVVLPEKLHNGKWNVHRFGTFPIYYLFEIFDALHIRYGSLIPEIDDRL